MLFFCYKKKHKKVPQQDQGDARGAADDYSPYEVSGTQSKGVHWEKGKVGVVAFAPQELHGKNERKQDFLMAHEMQG